MFICEKFQFVEIPLGTGAVGTITIKDQPSLRNKYVQAIALYTDETLAKSPVSSQNSLVAADVPAIVFEFFKGSDRMANRIPAAELIKNQVGTNISNWQLFRVDNWQLSWDVCNLIILSACTGNTTVTLGVYYSDTPMNNRF